MLKSLKLQVVALDTVQAWPQDRSGRSPTLEQGPKGTLGPQGAKIARLPWLRPPRAPKGPVKGGPGPHSQPGRSWSPQGAQRPLGAKIARVP